MNPAMSVKQTVNFLRWLAILTSWLPVKIELWTCGARYFASLLDSDSSAADFSASASSRC